MSLSFLILVLLLRDVTLWPTLSSVYQNKFLFHSPLGEDYVELKICVVC